MNRKQQLIAGVVFLGLVFGAWLIARPRNDLEFGVDDLAREYGAPQRDLERLFEITRKLDKEGGVMSNDDWNFSVKWVKSTNMGMAITALKALGAQDPSSPKRDQIVDFAVKNLDNPNRAGTVTGILVLRKFGDPRWQRYLSEYANSTDPESAKLGKMLQKKYGVIP